jgi:hypothetical protein
VRARPPRYVRAKHAYNATWPTKQDDFFPYADFPHAYWTGAAAGRPPCMHRQPAALDCPEPP